ncbi:MAG: alginate lyase family protein [Verrucomicrobiota bacterium]
MAKAEEILAGRYTLFSQPQAVELPLPPDWRRNQLSDQVVASNGHWSELGDFAFGDIKGVWELSRFGWAYTLARAYAATADNRFAERFWQLFEDWCVHNRPNAGPNWMCGQESTFRLMAVVFAVDVMAGAPASTPERRRTFAVFVLVTGRRVEGNIDYALSQSNNHGVSECIGLITASALLPTADESARWEKRGLRELRRQLDELVYPDGSFSQHSAIYHRVLLHDLLWCRVILQRTGKEVPTWLDEAGRRAVDFIDALMTPETGRLPLYGPNDGANVLPLADAHYLDFRPTVQAGYAVFHGRRRLPAGPWDEMARWLVAPMSAPVGGAAAATAPVLDTSRGEAGQRPATVQAQHFPDAGCLLWWSGQTRLFFRCPTRFKHRPSQADLLHVDLEWRGQPIAIDAGTFSYNTDGAFKGSLKAAVVHNTVTFDGGEPMQKVGRFLYLPWPKGSAAWREEGTVFEASHDGWKKKQIEHRRQVRSLAPSALESFEISDLISAPGRHTARLHWLLADLPHTFEPARQRLVLQTKMGPLCVSWEGVSAQASLVRADPKSDRGWWSPYYAQVEPALSLAIEFEFSEKAVVKTLFQPSNPLNPEAN